MAETVVITGLKELQARLKMLADVVGDRVSTRPVTKALRTAGKVLQKDMQSRVRVKTGTLQQNIIVARSRDSHAGHTVVNVTIRAKARAYKDTSSNRRSGRIGKTYNDLGPLFYARFLEFGTSKMKEGYPFMRKAFEAHKNELPELFRSELSDAIDKAMSKLGAS